MAYKILYIEDNPDNMRLIEKVLTARGYEVYGAENGLDGVSLAEQLKPDMILLDINLSDIDGYEVARRIRSSHETSLHSVTMIAITANVLRGDAEKALEAGCDAYMPKPINIQELWARVDAYLSGERLR
jgi:two-component system, cell cycle response regulator DivK